MQRTERRTLLGTSTKKIDAKKAGHLGILLDTKTTLIHSATYLPCIIIKICTDYREGASSNSRERKETLSGSTRRFDPDSGKSWSQCSRKQENRQDREVTKIEKEK